MKHLKMALFIIALILFSIPAAIIMAMITLSGVGWLILLAPLWNFILTLFSDCDGDLVWLSFLFMIIGPAYLLLAMANEKIQLFMDDMVSVIMPIAFCRIGFHINWIWSVHKIFYIIKGIKHETYSI